jgi:uncharacterized protein (DUF1330 family)
MINTTKQAYLMVQIKVKNFDDLMQRYGQFVFSVLEQYGGEMIAGSMSPKVMESDWDGNWAAILRFPSKEMAEAWYHSGEYQPLRDLRINELQTDGRVVLVEEFEPF